MKLVVPLLILSWLSVPAAADGPAWDALEALAGTWTGEGAGMGGVSEVTHEYERVLGHFVQMRTHSAFESADGTTDAEVHEDLGYFSFDTDRELVVLRQFLSEGYVNTYALTEYTDDRLVFETESTESAGGMQARVVMRFDGPDAYTMELHLAAPGRDWFVCRTLDMKRAGVHE
jgi:hypothetical protein